MPPLAGQEYLPNVAQRVSATIEPADQLDPIYGFFIEETLTGGAFTGGFDNSKHHVPAFSAAAPMRTSVHFLAVLFKGCLH